MKNGSVRFPNSPIVKLALACQPQTESSARDACAIQEFVGEDEALVDVGLRSIAAIRHAHNPRFDERVIDDLEALCVNWENPLDKNELVAWLARETPRSDR